MAISESIPSDKESKFFIVLEMLPEIRGIDNNFNEKEFLNFSIRNSNFVEFKRVIYERDFKAISKSTPLEKFRRFFNESPISFACSSIDLSNLSKEIILKEEERANIIYNDENIETLA